MDNNAYVTIYDTRKIAYSEMKRHFDDYLMECSKDCRPGDIIDNKIVLGFGMIEDNVFKCGDKVVAIPLDLIQEVETSNQDLEEYGFKAIQIKPFHVKRYINVNPY